MKEDVPFQQASNAALRLLSYRPRSEFELSGRLLKRFPKEIVEKVILWLKKCDLVNDIEFSKFWCKSRISSNPRSSWLLKKELNAKGVGNQTISQVLIGVDDTELAYRAALKSAKNKSGIEFVEFRNKLWGYLKRRGFHYELIQTTINRIWNEYQHELQIIDCRNSKNGLEQN